MGKQMSKQEKQEKRKQEIDDLTSRMEASIDSYFETPEQMTEYLQFMVNFRNYSPRNSSLIRGQFSSAHAVGSFNFWKENGHSVNKGEKGIKVLVPNQTAPKFKDENGKWQNIKYANEKQKELIDKGSLEKQGGKLYFGIGHVFDVSQTNAKASDLPEIFPNRWMEGDVEQYDTLFQSFEKIAKDMNVTIGDPFGELGNAKGAFYYAVEKSGSKGHIALNPRNSELQNVKTMIHELAHAKLHSGSHELMISTEEKEFQAEMVAYTTASYFGIDTSDYSLRYLANWTKGKEFEDKESLLREVRDTSNEFIDVIEQDLIQEKEMNKNSEISIDPTLKKVIDELGLHHSSTDEYDEFIQHIFESNDGDLIDIYHDKRNKDYELVLSREENYFEPHYRKGGLNVEQLNDRLQNRSAFDKQFNDNQKASKKYTVLEYGAFGATDIHHYSVDDIENHILEGKYIESITDFNKQFEERYTIIDSDMVTGPSIVVKWSEACQDLPSNKIIPYVEANNITTKLSEEQDLGYDKTWYSVIIPNEQGEVDVFPMDRLDIGDGQYVNLHHQVRKEAQGQLGEENWKRLDNDVTNHLLKEEKKEIDVFVKQNRKIIQDELDR